MDDLVTKLKALSQMIEWQFEKRVKIFRTDNAKDFSNQELQSYFTELGKIHETLCAYTPQQNGIAEQGLGLSKKKDELFYFKTKLCL